MTEHYIPAYRVDEDEAEPPFVTLVDGDCYSLGEFAPSDFLPDISLVKPGQVYREYHGGQYYYVYRVD
jgi:hypothetical protein